MNILLLRLSLYLKAFLRPHAKIYFILKIDHFSSILDVGCGNNSPLITKLLKPQCYYTGIDIHDYNQASINCADEYIIFKKESFHNGISTLPLKYDIVICNHNIEHVNNRKKTLISIFSKIKDNGQIYLAFPSKKTINLPSRKPILNYFDDDTHKGKPPDFFYLIKLLKKNNFEIIYSTENYQPFFLYFIGFLLEPISRILNRNLLGTWVYHGFESIIIAKKVIKIK